MYLIKQKPEDFYVEEIPLSMPGDKGDYAIFLLEKEDYNTESALQLLSRVMKVPRRYFSHAGNKDRQAATRQYCSFRGRLKDMEADKVRVKVVGYSENPLSLGDLEGNRFRIVVRNLTKRPVRIGSMINYFGSQRFGQRNPEAGLLIMKRRFAEAAKMISDRSVQEYLGKKPTDHIGAIRTIPFKDLKIYIHSVQSLLWNEVAASIVRQSPEFYSSDYRLGQFLFPKRPLPNVKIPILSFDTDIPLWLRPAYQEVMLKNQVQKQDFVIRSIPGLTPSGSERDLVAEIRELRISSLSEDELNKGMKKVTLEFSLPKGSYATIAIRSMFAQGS